VDEVWFGGSISFGMFEEERALSLRDDDGCAGVVVMLFKWESPMGTLGVGAMGVGGGDVGGVLVGGEG